MRATQKGLIIAGGTVFALLALAGGYGIYVIHASDLAEARRAYHAGDVEQTIELSTSAATSPFLLPRYRAQAYTLRGLLHYKREDYDQAIADLTAAVDIKPDPTAYRFRGFAKEAKGDYQGAISDLSQFISLSPSDGHALAYRGRLHEKLLNYPAAVEDYSMAVDRFPDFRGWILPMRAQAYAEQALLPEAISDILALPMDGLYDYDGRVSRGIFLDNAGAYKEAQKEFSEAIRLKPREADAYESRGISHLGSGTFEDAVKDFDKAIDLKPLSTRAYYGRGRANHYLGRNGAAIRDLEQSLSLDPSYMYPVLWLHIVNTKTSRPSQPILHGYAKNFFEAWPRPIVDFFIGKIDQETLFNRAADTTPSTEKEQLCEAYYYLGAEQLARGQRQGKIAIEKAAEVCPRYFVEYSAALHDLNQLAADRR